MTLPELINELNNIHNNKYLYNQYATILGESINVLTHGVTIEQLYYILEHEKLVPSRYWKTISLSLNGYFNLFTYRDAIFVFDFEKLRRKYKLNPMFYVPHITTEKQVELYGLSPLNLFWEMEIFTRQPISIYDTLEVVIIEENGATSIPQKVIEELENTYAIPTRKGNRNSAFFGENASTVRYLLHLMKSANYPSLTVDEPPKEVAYTIDKINTDVARIFGLLGIYKDIIRPKYFGR